MSEDEAGRNQLEEDQSGASDESKEVTIRVSSGARSVTSIVEWIRRQHEVMARTVKTFSHPFGESSISVELARIDRERRLMFEGPVLRENLICTDSWAS